MPGVLLREDRHAEEALVEVDRLLHVRHEARDVIHRLDGAYRLRRLRRVGGGGRGDEQRERGEQIAPREGAVFVLRRTRPIYELHHEGSSRRSSQGSSREFFTESSSRRYESSSQNSSEGVRPRETCCDLARARRPYALQSLERPSRSSRSCRRRRCECVAAPGRNGRARRWCRSRGSGGRRIRMCRRHLCTPGNDGRACGRLQPLESRM